MSQDSSLLTTFDLNTQHGVMSVLASIRASSLTPAIKNELRDLVFLYTNGGGDVSVKNSLEQKLVTHQISPVEVKKAGASASAPTLSFGSYRPTPTFKASVTIPASVPVPVPVVEAAASAPVSVVVAPPVIPAPPVVPVVAPTPAPIASVVLPVAQVAPVVAVPDVAVVPATSPVTATPEVTIGTESTYLERIRQIKTAVNSKVGNPVNLVDIDNQVGRDYMNTLLEAMKKLSSGAISEMVPAMQRLEAAYVAVEVAIAKHETSKVGKTEPANESAAEAAAVVVTPPVARTFVPPPLPVRPEIIQTVEMPVATPLPSRPMSTPDPAEAIVFENIAEPFTADVVAGVIPQVSDIPLVDIAIPTQVDSSFSQRSVMEAESGFATPVTASLADEKKILTPLDLPDPASLATSAGGDPLFTKEVDSGLDQLLSDWTLFKKSGLFGTGPKGSEHPLFKKIAELPVPLLLAGRFEGSTQEIRQSITDYMNGWRYEQGIIYQPGETFEKYLRRVIKHILDLQKKSKQA